MNLTTQQLIGFIGNGFLVIAYIPQIIKIIRTKKAEDISIWMWICYIFGDMIALIYALLTHDLVFSTLFGTFMAGNLTLITLKIKYDRKNREKSDQ